MPSREDFVAIATRLFAVWLGIQAIRHVFTSYAAWRQMQEDPAVLYMMGAAVPMLLIAWLLWVFPLTVARKLLPVMKTPGTPVAWASAGAMEIGLALIGFWLLASSLGDFFYWLTLAFMTVRLDGNLASYGADNTASTVATALEMAIALWLILGHRGILGAFVRLRQAGTRDITPAP